LPRWNGDLDSVIRRSGLIRLLTLYWCTNTQVTGVLPYWERTHLKSARPSNMAVPVGVFVTRETKVAMPSRDLVAATVPLTSWVEAPAGGHFISQEQPNVAANLVREFARHCRHDFPERFSPGKRGALAP
jgi:pimeloyl-ACP methyl ester carboxylesterase